MVNPYESPKSDDAAPPRPWWVSVGLWMIHTRRTALLYMWAALVVAIACVVIGIFVDLPFLAGSVLFLSALWYWLAIRWMDQNERW